MSKITPMERLVYCICRELHIHSVSSAQEIYNLKEMLFKAFPADKTDVFYVLIDYKMPYDGHDIFYEWLKKQGEKVHQAFLKHLGKNYTYQIEDGHVFVLDADRKLHTIDDDGNIMSSDPWEDYYKDSSMRMMERAKHLRPIIPEEIKRRLLNRKFCSKLSFKEDALDLATAGNFGALLWMIENLEEEALDKQIAFSIAETACKKQQWDVIIALLEKGMPVIGEYYCELFPFIVMIRCTYALYPHENSKLPNLSNLDKCTSFLSSLSYAVAEQFAEYGYINFKFLKHLARYFSWDEDTKTEFFKLLKIEFEKCIERKKMLDENNLARFKLDLIDLENL